MIFHSPWYLLCLLLLPLLAFRLWSKNRAAAVSFSSTDFADSMSLTWRQRISWLPNVLTIAALTLLIFALARPQEGREKAVVDSEGIAIEMVVDRSGSMHAMDFQIDGKHVDRLAAIKNVAHDFILGDDSGEQSLDGRVSDLIGLITFAGYADALTPPTLDHNFLVSQLIETQIVSDRQEDGTAIGDAIALAVEKLNRLDERQTEKVSSKVVILLTDGENTAGEFQPIQAAELAQQMNVRIYTIGVGTIGRAPFPFRNPLTGRDVIRWMNVNIDEPTLKKIAATTGGKYYRATDTASLQAIYTEIDQLEKTKVEATHYVDYRELAIQPSQLGFWTVPPLVTLCLALLIARTVLSQTILREFS